MRAVWYAAVAAALVSTVCLGNLMSGEIAGTELKFVIHIHDVSERLGQTEFACFRGVVKVSKVALNAGPPGSGYWARTYSKFKMRPFQISVPAPARVRVAILGLVLIFFQTFSDYTIVYIINVINVDLMHKAVLREKKVKAVIYLFWMPF